eukprot:TRINITY_DN1312_c0_g1_i4.p1 TRINITY_DN1312_c0_g1~~TRINITY_DN1312_c0_g1_i4.p1  ORF type:complete len:328 (+),score=15.56 TRINITY_DN1312_c0_g1_i4:81-1064(+)
MEDNKLGNPYNSSLPPVKLSTKEEHQKFLEALLTHPYLYTFLPSSRNLWINCVTLREAYLLETPQELDIGEVLASASVGTKIFLLYRGEKPEIKLLQMFDLTIVPIQSHLIWRIETTYCSFWALCGVLNKYLYILSPYTAKRYSIDSNKLVDIPLLPYERSFIIKPVLFQDRYLIALKEVGSCSFFGNLLWRIHMLDILDESNGWVDKGFSSIEFDHKHNSHFGTSPELTKGTNTSIYLISQYLEVSECSMYHDKALLKIYREKNKSVNRMKPGAYIPASVQLRGYIWLQESLDRSFMCFSYAKRKYEKVRKYGKYIFYSMKGNESG